MRHGLCVRRRGVRRYGDISKIDPTLQAGINEITGYIRLDVASGFADLSETVDSVLN